MLEAVSELPFLIFPTVEAVPCDSNNIVGSFNFFFARSVKCYFSKFYYRRIEMISLF